MQSTKWQFRRRTQSDIFIVRVKLHSALAACQSWWSWRMSEVTGQAIRRLVLDSSYSAHVGHIGSNLCVADILAALYGGAMNLPASDDPDRDRFVLSKGHAALALYAALHLRGWLDAEEYATFCKNGTALGVHPEPVVPGIDFATGSLGHGLSMGVGAALAARMQRSTRRAFVLMSDAECNEGSCWEAAMFAAHHKLGNLVAIIDDNAQQALGAARAILDLHPLAERWNTFGWQTRELDGHDQAAIAAAIADLPRDSGPQLIIAKTTFGKGVSYMESQLKWHYWPMNEEQYKQARREVSDA
jgi:transketolase